MGRIVAIGTAAAPLDLQMACLGTFSKYVENGKDVTVIVATERKPESGNYQQRTQGHVRQNERTVTMMEQAGLLFERQIEESFRSIGVSQMLVTEGIDHSVVTQNNVDVFRSQIESLNPTLAIIPFYKSRDQKTQIIGRSALLACRWIQNVLMYDCGTSEQSLFRPSIFSRLSHEQYEKKKSTISDLTERSSYFSVADGQRVTQVQQASSAKSLQEEEFIEAFEPHRLVLLSSERPDIDGNGLFE